MAIQPKSIKVNYFYNLIYEAVALLTPLLTTPYISRVLGAQGVGTYSYTYSIAEYFILFGNLGLVTYGQMIIAKERDDQDAVSKTFCELWLLRMITVSISLIIFFFIAFNSAAYRTPLLISGIHIIAIVFDFSWLFRGVEDFSKVVIRNLLVKLLCVVLIFVLVKNAEDVNIYIFLMGMSTLIGNLTYFISIPSVIKHISLKGLNIFQHLRPCLIYFIPTIATSVYKYLDKVMLGSILHDTTENGFYEQAHKIEQMLLAVITSFNTIMRSRMTYLFSEKKTELMHKYFDRSISFILMIAIPMTIGLFLVSPDLIPLFLGKGFDESIILSQIFAFLIVIVGLSNCINTHYLAPSGRQGKSNYVLVFGACANFICNLLLIPRFKAVGAAAASVFAETLILAGYLILSRDFIQVPHILALGWRYVLGGILMGICVHFVSYFNASSLTLLFIQVAAGMVSYVLFLLILRDRFALEVVSSIINRIRRAIKS